MTDHRPPFVNAPERQTVLTALEYLRDSVVRKAGGLDGDTVRRPMVGSGTSLLGLVKHLTMAETYWFPYTFAGDDVTVPADTLTDDDTFDSVVAGYRAATTQADRVIAAADLDQRAARLHPRHDEPLSLRWILVHMVEETARHAGHADIIREQLDGSTGR